MHESGNAYAGATDAHGLDPLAGVSARPRLDTLLAALHQVRVGVLRHREHLLQPRVGLLQRGARQRLAGELAAAAVSFVRARDEIHHAERPPAEHAHDVEAPVQNAAR